MNSVQNAVQCIKSHADIEASHTSSAILALNHYELARKNPLHIEPSRQLALEIMDLMKRLGLPVTQVCFVLGEASHDNRAPTYFGRQPETDFFSCGEKVLSDCLNDLFSPTSVKLAEKP